MDVFEQAARDSAAHRARVETRARLLAAARAAGLAGHREMIRALTFVAALEPYTRWADAAPGELGRPIGPPDDELPPPPMARCAAQIPRQPRYGARGSVAEELVRRRDVRIARRRASRTEPP